MCILIYHIQHFKTFEMLTFVYKVWVSFLKRVNLWWDLSHPRWKRQPCFLLLVRLSFNYQFLAALHHICLCCQVGRKCPKLQKAALTKVPCAATSPDLLVDLKNANYIPPNTPLSWYLYFVVTCGYSKLCQKYISLKYQTKPTRPVSSCVNWS